MSIELIESAAAADCAYKHGPDGPYTDLRFLHLLVQMFYKDDLPVGGVMHLTASGLAFADLGASLLRPPSDLTCCPEGYHFVSVQHCGCPFPMLPAWNVAGQPAWVAHAYYHMRAPPRMGRSLSREQHAFKSL